MSKFIKYMEKNYSPRVPKKEVVPPKDKRKTVLFNMLKIFEPTIVTKIYKPRENNSRWKVQLSRRDANNKPMIIEGDVLAMASGFKSLNRPMMRDFEDQTGYCAPPLMAASVTEICTDKARINRITNQILIVDNIVPEAVIAVIPKSDKWVTLTSLGKKLTAADVDLLFNAEAFKKYLDLPSASDYLRCKTICPAQVFTGPFEKVLWGWLGGHWGFDWIWACT